VRITTRIGLGLLLLTGLLLGVVGYQLTVLKEMREINQELSGARLEASRVSIRLMQGIEGVREFAAKSLLLGDAGYLEQWDAWEEAVEGDLAVLGELPMEEAEDRFRSRALEGWAEYLAIARQDELRQAQETPPSLSAFDPEPLDRMEEGLDGMRVGLEGLLASTDMAVTRRAETSSAAAEQARQVAWWGALLGLAFALFIGIALYLSISDPLRRLTRGTRELARGRFDHRLQPSGPAELSGLARDFNEMAERLNELEAMKRDFTSHVSHELKGPLAAIHETVLILLERIPGPLTAKQEHLLQLSHQSAVRLSGMISNLLEVSRLEAGAFRYHPQRQHPGEILAEAAAELAPLLEERELRVEGDLGPGAGPAVVCDGDLVRDVASNLLGNAVKFSPRGNTIQVRLREVRRPPASLPPRWTEAVRANRGPWMLLSVADRGTGVPDEHKEGIFEKFHQVRLGQRIHGQGVGLGLAISRQVVEAHEGAIWVEDREGGGSIFQVLLPLLPDRWAGLDFPVSASTGQLPSSPEALPAGGPSTASVG
jgi:signal transduction histidine kinase